MMHQLRPSVNKLSGLIGTLIHTPVFGEISVIQRGAVLYNSEGVITNILDQRDEEDLSSVLSKRADIESFVDYGDAMVLPGLIDAHCHAPQYVFTGTGMDLPLLEWLEKYTFPCESKFADLDFARLAYTKAVRRHLSLGTTFCSYFGTLHADAADVLVQVAEEAGQRAFVGKVSMDRNSPPYYVEATADGIRDAEAFVVRTLARSAAGRALLQHVNGNAEEAESSSSAKRRKTDGADADPDAGTSGGDDEYTIAGTPGLLNTLSAPLVLPCVTPRFVPTCSPEMLQALGALSRKYRLPLQSHLSESTSEIEWVRALHPECTSYGEVYHHYGLLHEAAYMAHCVHSGSDERRLLARSRTGAVHCASSNFNLCSGVMNARQFIRDGIKLGLGTDVAGGHSASMLDAIRQTIVASTAKVRWRAPVLVQQTPKAYTLLSCFTHRRLSCALRGTRRPPTPRRTPPTLILLTRAL